MSGEVNKQESGALSVDQQKMGQRIADRVMRKVSGCDDTAMAQAKYIAVHNVNSQAALPPWAIDLLLELVLQIIKKYMDERKNPPGDSPDNPPSNPAADGRAYGPTIES